LNVVGKIYCWGDFGPNGDAGVEAGGQEADIFSLELPEAAEDVVCGYGFSCALTVGHEVWCWGDSSEGTLGVGMDTGFVAKPEHPIAGLKDVEHLSCGADYCCALLDGGGVSCWGKIDLDHGNNSFLDGPPSILPSEIADLPAHIVYLDCGTNKVCTVSLETEVWCWGRVPLPGDECGEDASRLTGPTRLSGFEGSVSVAVSHDTICSVTDEGRVLCGGCTSLGVTGLSHDAAVEPVTIEALDNVVAIDGQGQVRGLLALDGDGRLFAWGSSIGSGSGVGPDVLQPKLVAGLDGIEKVFSGPFGSCTSNVGREVLCWGRPPGPTGLNPAAFFPQKIPELQKAQAIALFGEVWDPHNSGCAVSEGGELFCWGCLPWEDGEECDEYLEYEMRPIQAPEPLTSLSVKTGAICAVSEGGNVYCWGDNLPEVDGTGDDPRQIGGLEAVKMVGVAYRGGCALTDSGEVLCWGDAYSPMGNGSEEASPTPTPVSSPEEFHLLAVDQEHACAVSSKGEAWCWGSAEFGGLGEMLGENGQDYYALDPALVSPRDDIVDVSANIHMTCLTMADGTVECAGDDLMGLLGDGAILPPPRDLQPVLQSQDLVADGGMASVACGYFHCCGVSRAGRVFCWGSNRWGNCGIGQTTVVYPPREVVVPAE